MASKPTRRDTAGATGAEARRGGLRVGGEVVEIAPNSSDEESLRSLVGRKLVSRPRLSGFLQKQNPRRLTKSTKKRWFSLVGDALSYYYGRCQCSCGWITAIPLARSLARSLAHSHLSIRYSGRRYETTRCRTTIKHPRCVRAQEGPLSEWLRDRGATSTVQALCLVDRGAAVLGAGHAARAAPSHGASLQELHLGRQRQPDQQRRFCLVSELFLLLFIVFVLIIGNGSELEATGGHIGFALELSIALIATNADCVCVGCHQQQPLCHLDLWSLIVAIGTTRRWTPRACGYLGIYTFTDRCRLVGTCSLEFELEPLCQ